MENTFDTTEDQIRELNEEREYFYNPNEELEYLEEQERRITEQNDAWKREQRRTR